MCPMEEHLVSALFKAGVPKACVEVKKEVMCASSIVLLALYVLVLKHCLYKQQCQKRVTMCVDEHLNLDSSVPAGARVLCALASLE